MQATTQAHPHPHTHFPLNLMITRPRRRLVHDLHRLPTQLDEIPLEPQIADPGHIFLAIPIVIFKKQRQRPARVEQLPLHEDVLDLGRLGKRNGLCRPCGARGREVQVVGVDVEVEGARRRGRGGREDVEGVEADLAREAGVVRKSFNLGSEWVCLHSGEVRWDNLTGRV